MKTKTLLLLACLSLFQNLLFSQEKGKIIYTDFDNDIIRLVDSICIDINHDNILDCKVVHKWSDADLDYQTIDTYYNWEIASIHVYDTLPIMNHTNWTNSAFITMCWMGESEEFNFIFRHNINDHGYCYGWMRFSTCYGFLNGVCSYRYSFHEMAYCTIPNYPLKFGQKDFVDIEENIYEMSDVNLFPNPVEDKLSLQLPLNTLCNEVKIYNIAGLLLKTQNNDFDNIDLSYLSQGVYIVKINLNDGYICTKKIVKD